MRASVSRLAVAVALVGPLLSQPACERSEPPSPVPEAAESPPPERAPLPGDRARLRPIDPRLFVFDPEDPRPELLEILTRLQACRQRDLLPKMAELIRTRQWDAYVAEKRCDTLMRMPQVGAQVIEVDGEFVRLEIAPQPRGARSRGRGTPRRAPSPGAGARDRSRSASPRGR